MTTPEHPAHTALSALDSIEADARQARDAVETMRETTNAAYSLLEDVHRWLTMPGERKQSVREYILAGCEAILDKARPEWRQMQEARQGWERVREAARLKAMAAPDAREARNAPPGGVRSRGA